MALGPQTCSPRFKNWKRPWKSPAVAEKNPERVLTSHRHSGARKPPSHLGCTALSAEVLTWAGGLFVLFSGFTFSLLVLLIITSLSVSPLPVHSGYSEVSSGLFPGSGGV